MVRAFLCVGLLTAFTYAGCNSPSYDSTVQGTVTVDGELARRGRVVFHPIDDGPVAYGNIFENGTYSLRVGQGDLEDVDGGELASGEYIVTVVVNMPSVASESVGEGGAPLPGARITHSKYADKETSDLRRTVKPGTNVLPLELEAAEPVTESAAEEAQENGGDRDAQPSEVDAAAAEDGLAAPAVEESGAASAAEEAAK